MFYKQARFLTANLYIIKIQTNVNSIEHGTKSRGMVVPKQGCWIKTTLKKTTNRTRYISNKTTANIVRGVWRLKIKNYLAIANPGILVGKKGKKKKHTHTHEKQ